jgi:gas vesicle protein
MSRQDNSMTLLAGIVIGGVVGAAAGILFAPASGAETRRIIRKKALDLSKDVETNARRVSKDVEKSALRFKKDSIDPLAEDLQDKFEEVQKGLRKATRNSKPVRTTKRKVKTTRTKRIVRKA